MPTRTWPHTHALTSTLTRTHFHTRTHTRPLPHSCTHTRTLLRTHFHKHTHTSARARSPQGRPGSLALSRPPRLGPQRPAGHHPGPCRCPWRREAAAAGQPRWCFTCWSFPPRPPPAPASPPPPALPSPAQPGSSPGPARVAWEEPDAGGTALASSPAAERDSGSRPLRAALPFPGPARSPQRQGPEPPPTRCSSAPSEEERAGHSAAALNLPYSRSPLRQCRLRLLTFSDSRKKKIGTRVALV